MSARPLARQATLRDGSVMSGESLASSGVAAHRCNTDQNSGPKKSQAAADDDEFADFVTDHRGSQ